MKKIKKELKRTMDAYVASWNFVTPIGCGHSSSMMYGNPNIWRRRLYVKIAIECE